MAVMIKTRVAKDNPECMANHVVNFEKMAAFDPEKVTYHVGDEVKMESCRHAIGANRNVEIVPEETNVA